MTDRNTGITTDQIKDGTLLPTDFDATNALVDNYVPSYDLATGKFTWIPAGGISASDVDDFTIKYVNNKLKIADRIELNIGLLAFKLAVEQSKTIYNLVDGFIDEYEDESGVDTGTGGSENQTYDSVNDLYKPFSFSAEINTDTYLMLHLNNNVTDVSTGGAGSPHTVTNNSVTFDAGTKKWGSHSAYFNGTNAYLSIPDSPDWDICGSNTDDWTIDLWVKHTDHAGVENYITQFEDSNNHWRFFHEHGSGLRFFLKYGGILYCDGGYGAEIIDTNWHWICVVKKASEYALYKDGQQLTYVSDNSTDTFSALLTFGQYGDSTEYLDGNMDEIRIQHSNIFLASPVVGLTDTITIPTAEYSTSSGTLNMTLISESQTAELAPSDGRIVIFEEDVDAVTLNTDLFAYLTRDGGVTWVLVTLSDEGDYDNNIRILSGLADFTATGIGSGTSIEYKLVTANNKDMKIHGTAVNWDV